jgi:HPt (histidine-containing phosphotransfer) domain-containing protein
MEFYQELLLQYAGEAAGKMKAANRNFKDGDLKNYEILVHALKSTSKMIGAAELSEAAYTLEKAAKEGDEETIRRDSSSAMTEYTRLANGILRIFGKQKDASGSEKVRDDEILEFAPEAETDDEILEFFPETDNEILEFMPDVEPDNEIAEFASDTKTDGEVLEFAPEAEPEDGILEFVPETEPDDEILEFAPETESDDEILEFAPEGSEQP